MHKPFYRVPAIATLLILLTYGTAAASQAPGSPPAAAGQVPPSAPAEQVSSPTNPAQVPALPAGAVAVTACGTAVAPPAALPPAGSGPIVWQMELCFPRQGNASTIDTDTYMYYIKLRPSQPSQGIWVPYDDAAEQMILDDFKALWGTNFLEDLPIEATDFTFDNGVVGRMVVYNMEERERVKIVTYEGSEQIDRTKIDEQLRDQNIEVRIDSFLDEGIIRRVEGVLRSMMAEKGFTNAEVTHTVTPVAGGPKLVNVAFQISEGPKIKIRDIEFLGNRAFDDDTLQDQMKENKPKGFLSFLTGGGTYKEDKFEEDAGRITQYYREKGYVRASVGQPELKVLENSEDGKTRWVSLRIPVTEGPRYRVGSFTFDGNTVAKADALRRLFDVETGEWYNEEEIREGLRKTQEIYGAAGYMEFTGFPDYKMSDEAGSTDAALEALVPAALAAPPAAAVAETEAPTVDVTMRLTEGEQFFVNRITFVGNTTTRDKVIRRQMNLVEGGVFNTEALKYSVRRLNQLGYFSPLEGNEKDTTVVKTAGRDNAVDVTIKLQEQNRNQLTFGAGVSQYEGVFGQLGFQTSNFLGRGESLSASLQAGDRAQQYQLSFTEPFLFDRNITGGIGVFKRSLQYIGYYTQKSTGGNLTFGFPVGNFSRMFLNYSYEGVQMTDLNEALIDSSCLLSAQGCSIISSLGDLSQLTEAQREVLQRNPFVFDSLLLGQGGKRTISKLVPSFIHNTVDNPIFPTQGKRYTASVDLAVLGGNTQFIKPHLEGVWFFKQSSRTSFGFRTQFEYIAPVGETTSLPVFERLYLGGEYSVRGFDIRSIGPTVPDSRVVLGGNKSLLFNAEYLISIAGPVRLVLFYDAGQVRNIGEGFAWQEDLVELVPPPAPVLSDPFATSTLFDPDAPGVTTRTVGQTSAFKVSTGAELRFFMPVLNVPFRLIYSWNPQRGNVLNNNLQPAKEFTFRFAVGTTF